MECCINSGRYAIDMKIIYLIAATYRPAGMERVLAMKAEWLANHSLADCSECPGANEIVIVTSDQRGRPSVFGLDRFRQIDLGINYEDTNGAGFLKKTVAYFFKHCRHRRALAQLLEREKADVVISMFNNDADFVPYIKDGSAKLLEVHFSRFKKLQYARRGLWALADKWRTRADVKAAARFDKFIVLTREDMGYWMKDLREMGLNADLCCIPNPRSLEFEEKAALTNHIVMASGRVTHQKGFDMLLDAWAKANRGDWKLRVVGDGEDRKKLEERARQDGIAASVLFGPSDDIKREYLESSVFVLSSRYEGFGLVLAEAQAAGVPMVSFNCKCGPSEIITEGEDGFLVELGDIRAMADKIQMLMDDADLRVRMGAAARRNSERFAMSAIMPQWAVLLRESVKNHSKTGSEQ